jgi:hypothetical protein
VREGAAVLLTLAPCAIAFNFTLALEGPLPPRSRKVLCAFYFGVDISLRIEKPEKSKEQWASRRISELT